MRRDRPLLADDRLALSMPSIKLSDSDLVFHCAADDTILRAGLRAGVPLPYECNVGCCGTCKIELVSGSVEALWGHAPGLTEKDRARGRALACQSRVLSDCTIKAKQREEYRPAHRPQRVFAMLTEAVDVTHDIREFRFHASSPARFLPGQYALLSVPGASGVRAYSMCNLPNDEGDWHFQIKRVPTGAATAALFDRIRAGDVLEIDAPYGMAYLRPGVPRDIVCIAGGSGVSPVVSIARAFAREPELTQAKLHFFYGGRGPRDICGESMLCKLDGWGRRIFFYPVISMPELDTSGLWRGSVGLVHEHVVKTMGESLPQHEVYFAGPPAMAQAVQLMLHEKKVPPAQTHFDRFF